MLASVSVLAACDALGGELEQYVGGIAAGDRNLLRFVDRDAVTNDFGAHRVNESGANFEARRHENATIGRGVGDAAVNGQTGVGRKADDNRGRDVVHDLLRSGFRGHRLRRGRDDGGAARRATRGAGGGAGLAATIAQTGEQAAVAALRAAAGAARGASSRRGRTNNGGAAGRATGGATMGTTVNARRAAAGAAYDGGAARAASRDGGAAIALRATVAEVNRVRAGRQSQHQNC